jgi:hypothetical protein
LLTIAIHLRDYAKNDEVYSYGEGLHKKWAKRTRIRGGLRFDEAEFTQVRSFLCTSESHSHQTVIFVDLSTINTRFSDLLYGMTDENTDSDGQCAQMTRSWTHTNVSMRRTRQRD